MACAVLAETNDESEKRQSCNQQAVFPSPPKSVVVASRAFVCDTPGDDDDLD
jgi:hypothetical protein